MGADSQSTGYKLRQNLNMYASVAHVKSLEGLQSKYANIDCVIIREQSEERIKSNILILMKKILKFWLFQFWIFLKS